MSYQHPPLKTTSELIARYGNPVTDTATFEAAWMKVYILQDNVHTAIPVLPNHIYVNKDIVARLEITLNTLIEKGLHREIKTWDGCFNVRSQRNAPETISRHAFGIAIDLNSTWNPLNGAISWTEDFLNVWRNTGWICGADFHTRVDAMHFENSAASAW